MFLKKTAWLKTSKKRGGWGAPICNHNARMMGSYDLNPPPLIRKHDARRIGLYDLNPLICKHDARMMGFRKHMFSESFARQKTGVQHCAKKKKKKNICSLKKASHERAGFNTEQSRAKPIRGEPRRPRPCQASQLQPSEASRAEKSQAEPSRAEKSQAEPGQAEPSQDEPSQAEPSQAKPSHTFARGPVRAIPLQKKNLGPKRG